MTDPTPPDPSRDPFASLQARLDETHEFPGAYMFKFIVKVEHVERFVILFGGAKHTARHSASGRHVALTAELHVTSSSEVIALYRRAQTEFPDILSL